MFEVIAYPANNLGIGITDGKQTRQCTAGDLEILCEIANRSPHTDEVLASNSTQLLVRIDDFIGEMRSKQYEYNERFDKTKTKNEIWEHKADLLDDLASKLTEIVKAY